MLDVRTITPEEVERRRASMALNRTWAALDGGQVTEHRAGALATADAMFRSRSAPWCATWF
jgi:hypothetical protein